MRSNKLLKIIVLSISFLWLLSPLWAEGACDEFERDYVTKILMIKQLKGDSFEEDRNFVILAKKCGFSLTIKNKQKEGRGKNYKEVSKEKEENLDALIIKTANQYGIDPALLKALVHAESNFNRYALSPKGARGLTQVMPKTAESLGINPDHLWDSSTNLDTGVRYLILSLERHGSLKKALVAYNAGPNTAARVRSSIDLRKIPRETRLYLKRVLRLYEMYRASSFGKQKENK